MASNDTAALVVALSAQVSKFQKDMDQVNVIADKAVRKIEDRFKNANIIISKLASGTLLGNLLSSPISTAIDKVRELGDEFTKTASLAKFLQISTEKVQKIAFAAALGGVGFDQFRAESTQFLRNAEEAKRALDELGTLSTKQINRVENDFARLFKANGVSLTDAKGQLLSFDELLVRASDLIRNAKTELDKVRIAEMLGLSREWIRALEKGGDAFKKLADGAAEAGAVVDEKLLQSAKDFDRAWDQAMVRFKARFKGTVADIKTFFSDLVTSVQSSFGDDAAAPPRMAWLELHIARLKRLPIELQSSLAQYEAELADLKSRRAGDNPLALPPIEVKTPLPIGSGPQGDRDTKVPFKLRNKETELDKEIDQIKKRQELLESETKTIGRNTLEKERAKAMTELLHAAEHAGLTVTDEMREKINKVADAYARAALHAEQAKNKFDGVNEAMRFFGNQAASIFDSVLNKTATWRDAMTQALRALQSELLKTAFTGESAFSKLFGTASTTGGTGGLFGTVGKLFTGSAVEGNASGTDNWRGGPTWVGERGPELVNLPRGSQVIPNDVARNMGGGGLNVTYAPNIDARGADATAIARLEAVMQRDRADFSSRVVRTISEANRRSVKF